MMFFFSETPKRLARFFSKMSSMTDFDDMWLLSFQVSNFSNGKIRQKSHAVVLCPPILGEGTLTSWRKLIQTCGKPLVSLAKKIYK
jgi:hypothetical protein